MPLPQDSKPAGTVWPFLGGFFLMFGGWVAGFAGSITFVDSPKQPDPAGAVMLGYALVAGAVLAFALGAQVVARSYWGGTKAHPETLVLFFMTPIPALVAVGVNLLGRYFRSSDGTLARILLIAGGCYLAGTVGMKLADGFHLTVSRDDGQAFIWPLVLQAGVAAVLLGLVPPAREEPFAEEIEEAEPVGAK